MAEETSVANPVPIAENTVPPVVPPVVSPESTPAPVTTTETSDPIKARFATIASQRRAAEERAARLEGMVNQQAEQLREVLGAIGKLTAGSNVTTTSAINTAPPEFDAPRPARDAYADPESYDEALVTWAGQKAAHEASSVMQRRLEEQERERSERIERERSETEAVTVRRLQEEADAKARATWTERREKVAAKYEDYFDIAEDQSLPVSVAMAHTLMRAEDGAEILYYLGKHRDEAARIANIIVPGQVFPAGMGILSGTPVPDGAAQAYELGRIAAKLGLEIAPPAPELNPVPVNALASPSVGTPVAVLPTPPQPINGSSAPAINRDINSMSMEEYAAYRTPAIQAQRSPGRRQLQ